MANINSSIAPVVEKMRGNDFKRKKESEPKLDTRPVREILHGIDAAERPLLTPDTNGVEEAIRPFAYLFHLFDGLPRCSTAAEKKALLPYRLDPSSY